MLPWSSAARPTQALALDGGVLYVGGDFDSAGGAPRARLGALDAASAALLAWDPGADGPVDDLLARGNAVYVAGEFLHAGGVPVRGLAAIGGLPVVGVPPPGDVKSGGIAMLTSVPHPASAGARLRFSLPRSARVTLALYDVRGRRAAVVCAGRRFEAGLQSIPLAARLAPGVYVARLEAAGAVAERKLVVID